MQINKVYKMDVFDFLNHLPDDFVDLAIIDPPYNLSIDVWDTFSSQDEFLNFTTKYLNLVVKKMKSTSSLYIFNTPFNSARILNILCEFGLCFQNWLVWNKKDGFANSKNKYNCNQETILFFTKSNDYIFNFDEIREPYESSERIQAATTKGILKNGKRWFPNPKGKLCSDVWNFPSVRLTNKVNGKTKKQVHPTPKPEQMIERMIKASSNEGDLVLDLFSGSGTTSYVSKKNNRKFIGCEKNATYIEYIERRLSNE